MRRHRPSTLTAVVAVAAASLLVAACGSSTPTSTTTVSSSRGQPTQAEQQQMVAFAACMRSHGVSGFPDPGSGSFKFALAPSTPKSPAFQSAFPPCRHLLLGNGGPGQETHSPAQIAAALAFARCIRTHGFPSFPDPSSTGDLTHEMVAAAGINLHQPAVVQAGDACAGVTHGFITKATVARFVAGQ